MWKNRTSGKPKSVLRYELDKGHYLDPETSFTQSCFQNKKIDGQRRDINSSSTIQDFNTMFVQLHRL